MHTDNLRLSKPRNDTFKGRGYFESERDFVEPLERELTWAELDRLLDPHLFEVDGFGNTPNGRSLDDNDASMCIGDAFTFNAEHYTSALESCVHAPLPGSPCVLCNYAQAYPSTKRSGLAPMSQPGSSSSTVNVQTWSESVLNMQPFQNSFSTDRSYSATPSHVDSTVDRSLDTTIHGKHPITRAGNISTQRGGKSAAHRHQCATPLCTSSFGRPSDLRRHEADIHARAQKIYKCNSCGYAKRERKDKVIEHCKKRKHDGFSAIDVLENDVSGIIVSPVRTRYR